MATEKLIAGNVSSWTSLMTTDLNSIITGNAIIYSGAAIDGNSTLDLTAEFSFVGGGSITPTGSPFFGLYLYPQNGDGSTYGDGRFGSSAAGPPPNNYYRGYAGLPAAAGTQVGSFAIPGTSIFQIPLPRGLWKPVFYNFSGVTLTGTGNILYYRTTNRQVS